MRKARAHIDEREGIHAVLRTGHGVDGVELEQAARLRSERTVDMRMIPLPGTLFLEEMSPGKRALDARERDLDTLLSDFLVHDFGAAASLEAFFNDEVGDMGGKLSGVVPRTRGSRRYRVVPDFLRSLDLFADGARADAVAPADFGGGVSSRNHGRRFPADLGHVWVLGVCHESMVSRPSY